MVLAQNTFSLVDQVYSWTKSVLAIKQCACWRPYTSIWPDNFLIQIHLVE